MTNFAFRFTNMYMLFSVFFPANFVFQCFVLNVVLCCSVIRATVSAVSAWFFLPYIRYIAMVDVHDWRIKILNE